MKYFIVAVYIIGIVIIIKHSVTFLIPLLIFLQIYISYCKKSDDKKANRRKDIKSTPGCEKYEKVEKVDAFVCCKLLPLVFNRASYDTCEEECEEKGFCCRTDCLVRVNNAGNDVGKLDPNKMKMYFRGVIANGTYVRKVIAKSMKIIFHLSSSANRHNHR